MRPPVEGRGFTHTRSHRMNWVNRRFGVVAAGSCAALLGATGCVSQQEFSRVSGERDGLSQALAQTRAERDALAAKSANVGVALEGALVQGEDVASTLQAALDHSAR